MNNPYGLPKDQLAAIRQRDQNCVYCGVPMTDRKDGTDNRYYATIEHVYPPGNDPNWVFFCCNACNASHQVPLREWFKTSYCLKRNINEHTVAEPVRRFLVSGLKENDQLWLDGREHSFLISVAWVSANTIPDRPYEHIERERLSVREQKCFDRVVRAIARRHYPGLTFRDLQEGFGKYYGYMYWACDGLLNREPYDS